MSTLKFSKQNILSSKRDIDNLFAEGKALNVPPLRIIYQLKSNSSDSLQVLFSVPSRTFKKAVHRNLLKRRMREAFRINRHVLAVPSNLSVAYIYIAKKILPFSEIEKKVIQSFQKLKNEFEE